MSKSMAIAKALASLLCLVVLTLGVPLALVRLGSPLPHVAPHPADILHTLTSSSVSDSVLIAAVAAICWIVWAAFAVSVVLEMVRVAGASVTFSGPLQGVVAPLIATVMLILPGQSTSHAELPALQTASLQVQTISNEALPVVERSHVTVMPGDSLWKISSEQLGGGAQWPELWDANANSVHDGQTFTNPGLIHPGWELQLPVSVAAENPISPTTSEGLDAVPPLDANDQQVTTGSAIPEPAQVPQSSVPSVGSNDVSERHAGHVSHPLNVVAALVGGTIFAGVVVRRLNVLRSLQQRRRRPGRKIATPPPMTEFTERVLRAIAADDAVAWIDACLRLLTARLRADSSIPTPFIVCVRVGELGVELLLDAPIFEAPKDFISSGDGRMWTLDGSLLLTNIQEEVADETPFLMSLVTIGETPEGPVLVDLETVGELGIQGTQSQFDAFISGAALELAAAPWSVETSVVLTNPIVVLDGIDGINVLTSTDAATFVSGQIKSTQESLADAPSTFAARCVMTAGESWAPTVVIVPRSGSADQGVPHVDARGGSGVALVCNAQAAGGASLVFEAQQVTLFPLGLKLQHTLVDQHRMVETAELIRSAQADDVAPIVDIVASEPMDIRVASDELTQSDAQEVLDLPTPAVDIQVLGPVQIVGRDLSGSDRRRHVTEALAYLAVHNDRPVPSDRLRDALWPEGAAQSTFKVVMSKTRTAIGNSDDGQPYLPPAQDGAYRLTEQVGCDWLRFQWFVKQARKTQEVERTKDLLRQALDLVRGAPFADTGAKSFAWVDSELLRSQMEATIVDAAHELGEMALKSSDPELAKKAARKGLLAVPGQEMLYRLLMQAADAMGDHDEVDRLMREIERLAEALDPVAGAQLETLELHQRLTQLRRAKQLRRA